MSAAMSDLMALMNEPATFQEAYDLARMFRDIALDERRLAARRVAQLEVELATEREKWMRLKAAAVDADRQRHTIDVVSFMRGIEAELQTSTEG